MPDLKTVNLDQLTGDGQTAAVQITGSMRSPNAAVNVRVFGNFGGGNYSLEGSLDEAFTNPYSLGADAVFSAAGAVELRVNEGEWIRGSLAGSTAPTVDASIILAGTAKIN